MPGPTRPGTSRFPFELAIGAAVLVLCLWAAATIDPVSGYPPIKGDEATYVSMALSVAYDGDLAFERKDLERFWSVFRVSPDGIFLKRGKMLRLKFLSRPPFVRFVWWADAPGDKLYYGKAYVYAILAAPFVRLGGLSGLLVFNVCLLAGVAACAYRFARARAPAPTAIAFSLAFFLATIVPVYLVWYTPEILNLSLVFYAYFFWLYKEVAPPATGRLASFMRGRGSDVAAAVLIALATFSKPLNVLLAGPFVMLLWWRRKWIPGLVVGIVFAATVGGLFSVNAIVSGEFNYQGGDHRKSFYTWLPFATPEATFENARGGSADLVTNDADTDTVFGPGWLVPRLAYNTYYFVFGRHAGLLPYFFPGLVVLFLWMWKAREIRAWQVFLLGTVSASTLAVIVFLPYSWHGGGGPPGNRYFLNLYPVLFFLLPSLGSLRSAAVAWVVGTLFVGQTLVSPISVAKTPYHTVEHGAVRWLPVELTLVDDLPITLDRWRCRLPFEKDKKLSLYLLDENIYPPEPAGIWVTAKRRTDLLIRTAAPLSSLRITLSSLVPNHVWLSFGGRSVTVDLEPGKPVDVLMASTGGVFAAHGYGHILSVKADDGLVPMISYKGSEDRRYLGVLLNMQGTEAK